MNGRTMMNGNRERAEREKKIREKEGEKEV